MRRTRTTERVDLEIDARGRHPRPVNLDRRGATNPGRTGCMAQEHIRARTGIQFAQETVAANSIHTPSLAPRHPDSRSSTVSVGNRATAPRCEEKRNCRRPYPCGYGPKQRQGTQETQGKWTSEADVPGLPDDPSVRPQFGLVDGRRLLLADHCRGGARHPDHRWSAVTARAVDRFGRTFRPAGLPDRPWPSGRTRGVLPDRRPAWRCRRRVEEFASTRLDRERDACRR